MSEEQKKFELEKAKFLIDITNKFRLAFLFIAFLVLLFVMLGGKVWDDSVWFDKASKNIFGFLYVDLGFMLIATFIKFFFSLRSAYSYTSRALLAAYFAYAIRKSEFSTIYRLALAIAYFFGTRSIPGG